MRVPMLHAFFTGFPSSLLAPFRGWALSVHGAMIGATAILVFSGADWWLYGKTQNPDFYYLIMVAGIGGFFIPVLIPIGIYIWGEVREKADLVVSAVVIAQAEAAAWILSSTYKAFTGRTEPTFLAYFPLEDTSRNFNFGFLEYGIFWGWPSSHTAVAFALATALYVSPVGQRHRLLSYLGFLCAGVVALGALGFHWLSDVVAGAMLGALVGWTVYHSLHTRLQTSVSHS